MAIGAILAGAGSLIGAGMGVVDLIRAGKKQKEAQSFFQSHKYDVPESAQAALDVAQIQAGTFGLPGQDLMESKIQQSTAQGVGMAKEAGTSSSDVLAMLSNLYGQEQSRIQDIGISAAQDYANKQQALQGALGTMAGYENQKWQYNVLYPYQQMLGQAEALGTRGRQQLQSGLGGLMSVGMGVEQIKGAQSQYDNWFRSLFGGVQPMPTTQAGANAYMQAARSNMNLQLPQLNTGRTQLLPLAQ